MDQRELLEKRKLVSHGLLCILFLTVLFYSAWSHFICKNKPTRVESICEETRIKCIVLPPFGKKVNLMGDALFIFLATVNEIMNYTYTAVLAPSLLTI